MPRQNAVSQPFQVTPFEHCRMSPEGVVSLVEHLRSQPLLQSVPEPRLQAMAIAYLAHGGTDDNDHDVLPSGVHRIHPETHLRSLHYNWRDHLRPSYRRAVMDMLTWWDRMSGGGTLLLHAAGTRAPGTPATAEEVKLDVFLPLQAVRSDATVSVATARIMQHFAENVGVSIMHNWDRAKGLQPGGQLHNQNTPQTPSRRNANQPLMPRLISPYVTFYGRAPGTLEGLIALEFGDIGEPIVPIGLSIPSILLPDPPAVSNSRLPNPPSPTIVEVDDYTRAPNRRRDASPGAKVKDVVSSTLGVPSAARVGGPRRSLREQDSAVQDLQARILELENIITSQGEEIGGLRDILSSEDLLDFPLTTGKGKDVAPRKRSPSLTSVSSVSSESSENSSPSPSPVSHVGTPATSRPPATSIRFAPPPAQASGSQSPSSQSRANNSSGATPSYHYGEFTDHTVDYYELPLDTYRSLRAIQLHYAVAAWSDAIHSRIGVSKDVANEISVSMRKDWGLLPRNA